MNPDLIREICFEKIKVDCLDENFDPVIGTEVRCVVLNKITESYVRNMRRSSRVNSDARAFIDGYDDFLSKLDAYGAEKTSDRLDAVRLALRTANNLRSGYYYRKRQRLVNKIKK